MSTFQSYSRGSRHFFLASTIIRLPMDSYSLDLESHVLGEIVQSRAAK